MIIAIPRETTIGENRVAVTPEQVKKYSEWGFQVKIETSAGTASGFDDDDYLKAGAEIAPDAAQTYQNADIILKIWAPLPDEDRLLKPGQTIIANFQALAHPARVAELAKQGLTCFALDMLPVFPGRKVWIFYPHKVTLPDTKPSSMPSTCCPAPSL